MAERGSNWNLKYPEKRKSQFSNEDDKKKLKNEQWSLSVREIKHYLGRNFSFSVLKECGNFSVDSSRSYVNDQSQLKYIHLPNDILNVPLDLNLAYENAQRKPSITNEKLDLLLRWILVKNGKGGNTKPSVSSSTLLKSLDDVDFVFYRGLLTNILTTPYERREDWMICATKFKGSIYLVAFPTEQRLQHVASMTEREKMMCSWGYKFEQYLTKSNPNGYPEPPNVPVNENEEYCVVFKSKLNSHVMMYGAEVDGVSDILSNDARPQEYIELKTSRVITKESHNWTFLRYKTLKWWAQSYLISIKKIYCGFRNDAGVVQYIRSFSLPEIVDLSKNLWSPNVCFNFANNFLSFVKSVVVKDDPNIIYQFSWTPGLPIVCQELHSTTSPEFQILPEWYISEFES